jgi:hypothetical protein
VHPRSGGSDGTPSPYTRFPAACARHHHTRPLNRQVDIFGYIYHYLKPDKSLLNQCALGGLSLTAKGFSAGQAFEFMQGLLTTLELDRQHKLRVMISVVSVFKLFYSKSA